MPLRVLHVLLEARVGGPQLRLLGVASMLRTLESQLESGIETGVVLPDGDAPFASMLKAHGIPVYRTRLSRLRASLSPLVWGPLAKNTLPGVQEVVRIGRSFHADVMHIHGLYQPQGVLAAKRLGIPLVWHLNDLLLPRALVRCLAPWVLTVSDGIITVSAAVQRYLFDGLDTRGKVVTVYDPPVRTELPGVPPPTPLGPQELTDPAAQRWLDPSSRGSRLLTVGNLYSVKGHLDLVRAAAFVGPRAPLALVGAPLTTQPRVYEAILTARKRLDLTSRVWLAGFRDDIPELLSLADLYVHPSHSEACPLAVLEAMAAGKPVVATQVGGVPELVEDGKTGLLVPPRDPLALSRAIRALLADPSRRLTLGEAGKARVRERFSLERCALGHAAVYQAVTQGRAPEVAVAERMRRMARGAAEADPSASAPTGGSKA